MPRSRTASASIVAIAIAIVAWAGSASAGSGDRALGERIYRLGLLPSGSPLPAIVAGDVPVDGSQFPCESCHLRSGLGATEGDLITPPIGWLELAVPRDDSVHWVDRDESELDDDELDELPPWSRQGTGVAPPWLDAAHVRPAYTEASVLRAVREGVDPTGRTLNPVMPRYAIDDDAGAHLLAYLKTLSAAYSPGVNARSIRFATVIGPDVPDDEVNAMLEVLETFVSAESDAANDEYRPTATGGTYRTAEYDLAYRKLSLVQWRLHGAPDTWTDQLETQYEHDPVFALVGGISRNGWAPIHEFCERNHIPQFFPITDEPVVDSDARYTLYLSRGTYGEGTAAARYVRDTLPDAGRIRVLQLYRPGAAARAARGYADAWRAAGASEVVAHSLGQDEPLRGEVLATLVAEHEPGVLALWAGPQDVGALAAVAGGDNPPKLVLLSSSLLGDRLSAIPPSVRPLVRLTHPDAFETNERDAAFDLRRWLAIRRLSATHLRIRSQMYLTGWMLSEAIEAMGGDYYRERLLDTFDMIADQDFTAAGYPRLSFGPGQRYALKRCSIAGLSDDSDPRPVPLADRVAH